MRIPIVAIPLGAIEGGHVEILVKPPEEDPEPVITPTEPIILNENTRVSVGSFSQGGGGHGGGGGGSPGSTRTRHITIVEDVEDSGGTFAVDATLEVTGSFTQTDTGALRLFVGGNDPFDFGPSKSGGTYSQLIVGMGVTLDGALQVVLMPEAFDDFGYTPQIGDEFDFVISAVDVTMVPDLASFNFVNFVTADGADLIDSSLTLTMFDSGIAADPDTLFQIQEDLFAYTLVVEGGDTILRATLVQSFLASIPPQVPSLGPWGVGVLVTLLSVLGAAGIGRLRLRS